MTIPHRGAIGTPADPACDYGLRVAQYIFLDDGRRVDVTDGGVTVFPDDGFNFRDASNVGSMERIGSWWSLTAPDGRSLGAASTKKEAVLRLLEEAAGDVAAKQDRKSREIGRFNEVVAVVQRFQPDFRASAEPWGPFLVFSPDGLMELLEAVDQQGLDDSPDDHDVEYEAPVELARRFPDPKPAQLADILAEQIGLSSHEDLTEIAALAAIGLTNGAWRNTHLENLHAGNHPSGGIPDADMMRFNIATTRLVREYVTADGIDWDGLTKAMTDPDRALPGGTTVEELAGDEYEILADDIEASLWGGRQTEADKGLTYALSRFAAHGALACQDWWCTPWWQDGVDVFIERLADPSSEAWRHDDGRAEEPARVVDRDELRRLLLDEPEALDDSGIYWCLNHGLSDAARAGFERWRERRAAE
jgi:hypothetical protein